jgi:bacillopeptidase F (M6 metalloprotease family)
MKAKLFNAVIFLCLIALPFIAQNQTIIWSEDFEAGIGSWYATNGVWQVGVPTSGPNNSHSGVNCGATNLSGNYPDGANTRFVTPPITLPGVSGDNRLRVRFWQWFAIENGYDHGIVQITTGGNIWHTISETEVDGGGGNWTCCSVDMTGWADSTVRIAFYFTSDGTGTGAGWYIDDVSVVAGPENFNTPENFESGLGDWSADNGQWELGIPVVGPSSAHSLSNCIGTVLNGNYTDRSNTRLISPRIRLPIVNGDDRIRLRFWQWNAIENGYDQGVVQISVNSGPWVTASQTEIDGSSVVWTNSMIDLTEYAGLSIRVGFFITSDGTGTGAGWYIDDVALVVGPEGMSNPENFESGIGDWSVDNGLWELGTPVTGPSQTHSGVNCFATVLNGNYSDASNTRLISPMITVSPSQGQFPGMFFWQWFQIEGGYDKGFVQVATEHGSWVTVAGPFTGNAPEWSQGYVDLTSYVDSIIRIAFYFTSDGTGTASGWYIDDVRFEGVLTGSSELIFQEASLARIWPNPFFDEIQIRCRLTQVSRVKIELLDLFGRSCMIPIEENGNEGINEWALITSGLSPGVYFIRVWNGNMNSTSIILKK